MKITFNQQTIAETEQKQAEKRRMDSSSQQMAAVTAGAFWTTFDRGNADIMPGQGAEKGKSLIELQQEAANTNVAISQDYMTLAANTMSEEDYAKMQEEGFDFGSMEPEEAVRVQSYLSATMSAGSVAAMFAGGVLCQFLGVQAMVAISAGFAFAGACIVILWVQKNRK